MARQLHQTIVLFAKQHRSNYPADEQLLVRACLRGENAPEGVTVGGAQIAYVENV